MTKRVKITYWQESNLYNSMTMISSSSRSEQCIERFDFSGLEKVEGTGLIAFFFGEYGNNELLYIPERHIIRIEVRGC